MEKPQEAAAEAKPKGGRRFRLKIEGCVVEPKFIDRISQVLVLVAIGWIKAAEDHAQRFSVTRTRFGGGVICKGDRVTDTSIADAFHRSRQETNFPSRQSAVNFEGRAEVAG